MEPTDEQIKLAKEVAQRTVKLLKSQGWCFWRCSALNGDIITVMNDPPALSEEAEKKLMSQLIVIYEKEPEGKVNTDCWLGTTYTTTELKEYLDMADDRMAFIHEAKKISHGTLMPKEQR